MPNNLFYKTVSIIGTLGIVILSSTQVWTSLKKQNNSEAEISKTLSELKKAKKETLSEVELIKKEVLKELREAKKETLKDIRTSRSEALKEVKTTKDDAITSLNNLAGKKTSGVWLILRYGTSSGAGLEKIEMASMDQCEFTGAMWESSKRISPGGYTGFECLEDK